MKATKTERRKMLLALKKGRWNGSWDEKSYNLVRKALISGKYISENSLLHSGHPVTPSGVGWEHVYQFITKDGTQTVLVEIAKTNAFNENIGMSAYRLKKVGNKYDVLEG